MTSRVCAIRVYVASFALALAGCEGVGLPGRAVDEWTRSYPLADGGQVEISNTNGIVEVEGVTGSTVDIRAERVAKAATDSAARDVLSSIAIKEDVSPNRVAIESGRTGSGFARVGYEVHYHVRAPKNAVVRATTTNGSIVLHGLSGRTTAATTNGEIRGDALGGGISARTANGRVDLELAALGAAAVDIRTTNGRVSLTVPEDARVDLDASVTNGAISVSGLRFEASDQSRRHLAGRINGGGTPVTVSTTNGAIRIGSQ